MFVVERDSVRRGLYSDVQLAAFLNNGWVLAVEPVAPTSEAPVEPGTVVADARDIGALKAEATALGIEFRDNIGYDKLLDRIRSAKVNT